MERFSSTAKVGGYSVATTLSKNKFDDGEKSVIDAELDVLELFRTIRATMPLQYAVTLLMVARDEGKSVTEYARKLGVSNSVMSRHLLDIGERNRHMTEGFGLVTYRQNPINTREHEYYLTPKGYAMVQRIIRAHKRSKA